MGVTKKGGRGQPPYFTGFREFQPTSIPITSHASASFRRKGARARCFLLPKNGTMSFLNFQHDILFFYISDFYGKAQKVDPI